MVTVTLGIERLIDSGALDGQRVGLVANPASVDHQFRHASDRLADHPGITLAALFGPQHGFHADSQDDMIETPHAADARRSVPVYSLYSETRIPTKEMLAGLDVLVIDLQDVGTRVYTFAYTMAHCLEAAARHGLPVIVCDRPNPIGGIDVEGPVLERGFESFVGLFPIPLRHGMTMGELARLFNGAFGLGADLQVIEMTGWNRRLYQDETDVPWVIPSPNMPTLDTATVYPGGVLFEGTTLSEGRGTTRPFELVGAPGFDADALAASLNAADLPGVRFRPVVFEPTFQKHARQPCAGCQLHVTDRRVFRPVLTAVAWMAAFHRASAKRFSWREPPYEYEHEKMPIDVLSGSSVMRSRIERGDDPSAIARDWEPAVSDFLPLREGCLLYQ